MVGVDKVVGGEGVRADGGATGVQGFLWEEKKVGQREREEWEEEEKRVKKEERCRQGRDQRERGEGGDGEVEGEDESNTVCTLLHKYELCNG